MTKDYGSAFISCAAGMAVSAVFLGLVRPAKRGLLCKKRTCEHIQVVTEDTEERTEGGKPDERTDGAVNSSVPHGP